ncbi:hypothetical protein FRC07_002294 [Ceratobasidium sp. 392]|nr:hypothetical protein FRC07_002294 [Ceratobasidium sp. 392]
MGIAAAAPDIRKALLIGLGVGVTILVLIPLTVTTFGIGPAGIIAGSAAAGLQSTIYGGLVPAGSAFASLTSTAMSGTLLEMAVLPAAIGAVGTGVVVGASTHDEN